MPDRVTFAGSNSAAPAGAMKRVGRRTQIAAGAVVVILAASFVVVSTMRSNEATQLAATTVVQASAPPPVDVAMVKSVSGTTELTLPGETAAWYEATIYSRVSGYVGKWSVDIGDHVKQGQTLATIETPELDAELAAAEAKLKAAEADVQVRQAQAEFADTTYQRWKDAPTGSVSVQETEDKKAGYVSAQAELAAANAQVGVAQNDVNRLQAFQAFKRVTAPFTGIVTQRRIDIGNLVTAGSSATMTPLYRIAQNDPIRVFIEVPQSAAASMKPGTQVDITTNGTEAQTFTGKIARTSDAVDPQARTLRVEVDIPNKNGGLVPGLYVETGFHLPSQGRVIVPAAAMIFSPQGPKVAVVSGDHVRFRKVTIAEDDGSTVQLGSGVRAGENVVLNISNQITDGQKVQVSQIEASPDTPSQEVASQAPEQ